MLHAAIERIGSWALLAALGGVGPVLLGESWWWLGGPLAVFLAAGLVVGLWESWGWRHLYPLDPRRGRP